MSAQVGSWRAGLSLLYDGWILYVVCQMSDEVWTLIECEICSKVASWKREEGIFCDRCKEDWPDGWY